jgi:hypothetical protein
MGCSRGRGSTDERESAGIVESREQLESKEVTTVHGIVAKATGCVRLQSKRCLMNNIKTELLYT